MLSFIIFVIVSERPQTRPEAKWALLHDRLFELRKPCASPPIPPRSVESDRMIGELILSMCDFHPSISLFIGEICDTKRVYPPLLFFTTSSPLRPRTSPVTPLNRPSWCFVSSNRAASGLPAGPPKVFLAGRPSAMTLGHFFCESSGETGEALAVREVLPDRTPSPTNPVQYLF
jgi:hypothetical protein